MAIDTNSLIYRLCERIAQKAEHPIKYKNSKGIVFNCPFCHSGTGDNKTSAFAIDSDTNRYVCFNCGAKGDIYDLVGEIYSEPTFLGQKQRLAQILNIPIKDLSPNTAYKEKDKPTNSNSTEKPTKRSYSADYSAWKANNKQQGGKYLESRGISLEIQNKYDIGYCEKWVHPTAKKAYPSKRVIIPNGEFNYLARATDSNNSAPKMKVGTNAPLYLWEQMRHLKTIFVCEGEIDTLSILELRYKNLGAIALGSVSNKDKFIKEAIKEAQAGREHIYFIWLDTDKAGQTAQEEISAKLWANSIPNCTIPKEIIELQGSGVKDINGWLQQDIKTQKSGLSSFNKYVGYKRYYEVLEQGKRRGFKLSQLYALMNLNPYDYPDRIIWNCERKGERERTPAYIEQAKNEVLFIIGYWNNKTRIETLSAPNLEERKTRDILPLALAIAEQGESARYCLLVSEGNRQISDNTASTYNYIKQRGERGEYKHAFIMLDNEPVGYWFNKLPNTTAINIDFKALDIEYLKQVVKALIKTAQESTAGENMEKAVQVALNEVRNYG